MKESRKKCIVHAVFYKNLPVVECKVGDEVIYSGDFDSIEDARKASADLNNYIFHFLRDSYDTDDIDYIIKLCDDWDSIYDFSSTTAWEGNFDPEEAAEVWFGDVKYAKDIYQWLKKEASDDIKRLAGQENLSDDDDEMIMDSFMSSGYYKESTRRSGRIREAAELTESVRKNRRAIHEAGESETTSGYDKAKLGAALNAASRKITPARFFKMLKEAGMSDTDIYNFQEYLANEEQIFEEDYSEADLALHGSEWLAILGDYEGVEVDWDNCKDLDKEIEKYLWKYSEDNYQNRAKSITAEYCEGDIFYIYYLSQEGDSEEILEDIENMPFIEALVDAGYTPEVYVNDRDANHSVVIAHYKDGKWLDGDAGEEEVDNVDLVQKCWPNLRGENIDLIAGWYDEEGGEFDEDDFMDMLWASSYDDDEVVALQQDLIDCGYYEADEMPHDFTGEKVNLEDWCWDNKLDSVAAEQFKKYLDKVGVLGDKDMPPEEFEELYVKFQNAKVK